MKKLTLLSTLLLGLLAHAPAAWAVTATEGQVYEIEVDGADSQYHCSASLIRKSETACALGTNAHCLFSDTTAVRVFALEDLNVVYPHDRLIELEAEGTIGSFAERTVSMVGSITRYGRLVDETVPKIHAELDRQGVDLAILIPL